VPKNYIVDASALVAFLSAEDQHHAWMVAQAKSLASPWHTCEAALTETFHLLRQSQSRNLALILKRQALKISFEFNAHIDPVLALMDKYSDVPMSVADACLVRMTETLPDPIVITTDSDFRIYRRSGRLVIPCSMP
jgi:predicted nucleic acid-binding protein